MNNELVLIENQGCPEISTNIENIRLCMTNKRTGFFDVYKIVVDSNGVAQLKCVGDYDHQEE